MDQKKMKCFSFKIVVGRKIKMEVLCISSVGLLLYRNKYI